MLENPLNCMQVRTMGVCGILAWGWSHSPSRSLVNREVLSAQGRARAPTVPLLQSKGLIQFGALTPTGRNN